MATGRNGSRYWERMCRSPAHCFTPKRLIIARRFSSRSEPFSLNQADPSEAPGALLSSKLVSSFLYGIKPNDPLALAAAVGILLSAVLLAGYAPARRASRIEPMAALRQD